mgnify:CR=1 FL=1
MFERFHRVEDARGRSHEGSGIGARPGAGAGAKLHGGTIVTSRARRTSAPTFTVEIPKGSAPPAGRRVESPRRRRDAHRRRAAAYVAEALELAAADESLPVARPSRPAARRAACWRDDNADLREYARRLLAEHYEVEVVGDGRARARGGARAERPTSIVTDVMMPSLDGFGLIRELRADPALRARSRDPAVGARGRGGAARRPAAAAPTTTWPSRSARASCWCATARCSSRTGSSHARSTRCARRTAARTSSSPRCRTSCATRSRRSATRSQHAAASRADADATSPGRATIMERQVNHLVRLVDDLARGVAASRAARARAAPRAASSSRSVVRNARRGRASR